MRTRVSQEEDYIEQLTQSIEQERAKDPDVVLPWEWWKKQAELYKVTPNNIYSRAIKHGLYTPPSRRVKGEAAEKTPRMKSNKPRSSGDVEAAVEKKKPPVMVTPAVTEPVIQVEMPPAAQTVHPEIPPSVRPASSPAHSATRILTERLQAMTDVADLLGQLEGRIGELEREKEVEAARQRETVRALDRLARVLEEASGTVAALRQLYQD